MLPDQLAYACCNVSQATWSGCCAFLVCYLFFGRFLAGLAMKNQGSLLVHKGTCMLQMQAWCPPTRLMTCNGW